MRRVGVYFLALALVGVIDAQFNVCVTHGINEYCDQMMMDLRTFTRTAIQCVQGRDKIDCMKKVSNGLADFVNLGANEAYLASLNFSLDPIGQEQRDGRTDGIMYESVVVIKRGVSLNSLADLKTKRSCHTGYGRTAGWSIPMAVLRASPDFDNDCSSELSSISKFFSKSCVPGAWAADPDLDAVLKNDHSNLCQLCKSKCQSTGDDAYLGYKGALDCLTETEADVAFTKYSTVLEYFRGRSDRDSYRYLCSNGSSISLDSNCFWAARPNNYFMTRRGATPEERNQFINAINQVVNHYPPRARPMWLFANIISNSTGISGITAIQHNMNDSLEQFNYKVTMDKPLPKPCKEKFVTICVTSKLEMEKCKDLKAAAFAQRLRPLPECRMETDTNECFRAIQQGIADVITVDSGELFQASKDYGLIPILSELYDNGNTSYYAVAVVKKSSKIGSIQDLKDKKSCHTGFRRTAGWNVPIGVLKQQSLIEGDGCDIQNGVAKFFEKSCVPGVSGAASLCELCEGDEQGEHVCVAGASERFYGYSGAFRCLAEGKGDVAFVKHTTTFENTDGRSSAAWALNLRLDDYSLLCKEGARRLPTDFETCNWATIPAHQVVTSSSKSASEVMDIKLMLLRASAAFSPNRELFKLFGKYDNQKDLLFKDSALGLVALPAGATAKTVLKDSLYNELESTFCSERNAALRSVVPSTLLAAFTALAYFIRSAMV